MANHNTLLQELATREAAGELNIAGWLASLPDPDPVLRKKGEYASILSELTADEQVCTAIQQRKLKTLLKRDYKFSAGVREGEAATPEAEALRQALNADLERVDLYNLIAEVLDAPYYGHTVAELIWAAAGDRLTLRDVAPKPRTWFSFDYENRLCFQGWGLLPTLAPEYKFVLARHFPTFENPYGLRLLSRCLWPVAFKKGGVRFWTYFCEKYGQPWVIGKAGAATDARGRATMAAELKSMVRDAVAVVSGAEIEVHEFGGKAGDLHHGFVSYWDAAISKVLMGQTLTADIGDVGSRAAAQTHYEVLDDLAAADGVLVETFFNELAWSYGQVNAAPGVLAPRFAYEQPEDQAAQAELDNKLYAVGVRFKKPHFVERYGLPEEHFDLEAPAASAIDRRERSLPSVEMTFAAPDAAQPGRAGQGQRDAADPVDPVDPADAAAIAGQAQADGLADAVFAKAAPAVQARAGALLAAIEKAESYDDARLLLAEALGQDFYGDDDALALELLAGMVNAELLGRWTVKTGRQDAQNLKE